MLLTTRPDQPLAKGQPCEFCPTTILPIFPHLTSQRYQKHKDQYLWLGSNSGQGRCGLPVWPPDVTQDQGGASGRSTTRATGENSSRGTLRVLAYNESFSKEMQSICIHSEVVAHQVVAFLENIEHALALLTKAREGVQLDFEHPPTRNQELSSHVEVVSMAFQNGIICIAFR